MSDSSVRNSQFRQRTAADPEAVHPALVGSDDSGPRVGSMQASGPVSSEASSTQTRQILIDGENISPDDPTIISSRPPAIATPSAAGTTPAELGVLLEGERLDHFELDQFIGGGGMGAVFRGTDTALGRTVAIKVLLRQYATDEETVRRFQNEAQSAARLDHENIARVYFVGEDRGWHYIVLEYVEGDNIRDLVYRDGPLPLSDVVSYGLQIAEALAHASGRDVVHRDIKPSNVLITAGGQAKLVDMGLARLRQVENSHEDLTASGVTLGTFDYISPEQARDPRNADVRSDLYSLGCTFYFMLTGRPPFPDGTVLQKLLSHQGDAPPDPRELRSEVPESVCRITYKLLAKNPKDRYQEPGALVAELLMVGDELGLQYRFSDSTVWVNPRHSESTWWQRHLPWAVPVALLLIVVALVDYSSSGQGIGPPPLPRSMSATDDGAPDPTSDTELQNAVPPDRNSDATAPRNSNLQPAPAQHESPAGGGQTADAGPVVGTSSATDTAAASETARKRLPGGSVARAEPGTFAAPLPDKSASPDATGPRTVPKAKTGTTTRFSAAAPDDPPPVPPKTNGSEPLLLVTGNGDGEHTFDSLADACLQATNGATIELRYNGRLEQPERPLQINQGKLTIRAGESYQPVVRFQPQSPDPILYPRSMIHVVGGELTLSGIHFELDIPSSVRAEDWTLFEAVVANKIRLMRCSMTIRNAADDLTAMYKEVSFFKIKAPPRRESTVSAETKEPSTWLNIDLRNCIVRGEATLLRGTALDTVRLKWENGLLATSERLVDIEAQVATVPMGNLLEIEFERVTALARDGFCRMASREDERHLITTRMDFTDCILITADAPLIEQSGLQTEQEFRRHLLWNANHNFYEDFDVFWRIDSQQNTEITEMDWTAWQDQWGPGRERMDRPAPVVWAHPASPSRAASRYSVGDFVLDTSDTNPARSAATDGMNDAGMDSELLPELPPDPDEAPSAAAISSDVGITPTTPDADSSRD